MKATEEIKRIRAQRQALALKRACWALAPENVVFLRHNKEPFPSWMPTCGTEAEVWARENGQFSNGRKLRNG